MITPTVFAPANGVENCNDFCLQVCVRAGWGEDFAAREGHCHHLCHVYFKTELCGSGSLGNEWETELQSAALSVLHTGNITLYSMRNQDSYELVWK